MSGRRVTLYLPDWLRAKQLAEAPDLNLSELFARALLARLAERRAAAEVEGVEA